MYAMNNVNRNDNIVIKLRIKKQNGHGHVHFFVGYFSYNEIKIISK